MSDLILVQENSTPETVELISPGPQGPSGTFTIGTITTGLPGTAVNITNTGTPSQAVLNFTIPRGDVGDITPALLAAKVAAEYAATAAGGSASTATTQAGIATTQASTATAQANLATTKAADAVTAAGAALASQNTASTAATTATNQANTATTQAGIATTKASEAVTSASSASGYATAAAGSANASATSAANSSGYSSLAQEWATKTSSEVALGQGYGAKKYALDAASMAAAAEIAAAGSLVHSQTAAGHSQEASTSADNANTSASVSSDASVLATLRAGQAAESASTSSSQAANASASAATATSQASSATTSASTASTQAGIATTKASEAATSASAASVSAAAALASQTASSGSAAAANTSAGSAAGSASSALAIYGTTNAQQAALVAAQSAASLAQGFALSASSAIQQDLSGVTAQALHRSPNAVTAMFVYDTSKDSDGGAWTEKCQHTSWYNEALNGKWLGSQFSELSARSEAAVLGPELITNKDFSNGTTGWSAGYSNLSVVNGRLRVTASTTGQWADAVITIPVVSGRLYQVSWEGTDDSNGRPFVVIGAGITSGAINTRKFTSAAIATTPSLAVTLRVAAPGTSNLPTAGNYVDFDNISVREVTALTTASGDYYQSTVDGKFYRLWKNLLTYSSEFDNAAWVKTNATVTANTTAAPDGTLTADTLTATAANGTIRNDPVRTGEITNSIYVKRKTGTGSVQILDATGAYRTITVTSDWTRVSYAAVATSVSLFGIRITVSGDEIYVWNAQSEYGSTATAYEAKGAEGAVSETFRGNKADFPRLAGIVAEASNVTIYDLTEAGRPMWMRFTDGFENMLGSTSGLGACVVAAMNARLAIGNYGYDLKCVDFILDKAGRVGSAGINNNYRGSVAERNSNKSWHALPSYFALSNIVSRSINAVAMTVLPDAPVDIVSGLQVPTIAVATAGGVSVIKHNGTVVNSATTSAQAAVTITPQILASQRSVSQDWNYALNPGSLGASFAMLNISSGAPDFARNNGVKHIAVSKSNFLRFPAAALVSALRHNEIDRTKSVSSVITNTFNTGHLIGDIRRAYLADVDVGSVSGSTQLLTTAADGNFSSDTGHWSTLAGVSISGGTMNFTGVSTGGSLYLAGSYSGLPINTKVYLTYTISNYSSGTIRFSNQGYAVSTTIRSSNGTFTELFDTGSNGYLYISTNAILSIDDLVISPCVQDRSYKAQAASITGTLTKTQVALAAQTVAYSGFSAANYLREPYSADLDFGTGEWSASAWVNTVGRKNLLTFSEQFNNSAWLNNSAAILSNSAVAPDGTTTADKIVITNGVALGTSTGAGVRQQPSKSTTSITYSESIYAQAAEFNSVMLFMANAAATNGTRCTFNLVTGTYSSLTSFGSGFSGAAASIEAVGGGWYRCSLTTTSDADAAIRASVLPIDTVASQGNGTSGIYVWGAQFEVGAIATDYQKVVDGTELYFPVADRSHSSGASLSVGLEGTGKLKAIVFDGTTTRTVTTTAAYNTATWIKPEAVYTTDGTLAIRVNGVEVAATRGTPLLSLNSRYNLLTKTEDFSDSAWSKVAVTVTTNATTAPDGATTADKIVATNTASATRGVYESISPVSGVQYVIGFSVKASEYSKLCVAEIGGGRFGATFDLTAETTTSLGGAGFVSSSITATGNGWYRCVIVATAGSSGWSVAAVGYPTGAVLSAAGCSYAGDGTSGVFIWGASIVPAALSALPYQWVNTATDFNFSAPLTIGNSFAADAPFPGSIALLKFSATVPTAEQSQWMYEQEKQMFRDGAQVTLPDAGAIVDLTYDDATDKWIAVSATNESEWSGLVRTSVTASPAGSYTKVAAASGVQLQARSTTSPGVDITIPSYGLREELVRRSESAARLARNMVAFDYVGGFTANTTTGSTAIASVASLTYPVSYVGARISGAGIPANTTVVGVSGTTIYISAAATATASGVQISFVDFNLPVGYEAKNVLSAGATKVEGATKDFTRLFDGFKETIRFGTAPGFNVPVQIQATRSAQ